MKSIARFSVDPRLSALLGESYPSSERALRELVDNAWDAEVRVVKITLPYILSEAPVIIDDDGHGMKNQEVRQEYLKIASPRFSRKGERTPNLDRKVKGRRGIGKFSGLMHLLACYNRDGTGTPRNTEMAKEWLRRLMREAPEKTAAYRDAARKLQEIQTELL